jgi:hypothetical protein
VLSFTQNIHQISHNLLYMRQTPEPISLIGTKVFYNGFVHPYEFGLQFMEIQYCQVDFDDNFLT